MPSRTGARPDTDSQPDQASRPPRSRGDARGGQSRGGGQGGGQSGGGSEESKGTVLLAGAANLGIAIAKIVAGLLSGSSAMLAEGAHSVADTMNQVFLLTALARSRKPADSEHPFGYAQERYFWSLLAAVGIFVLGAGFSFYEGIHALIAPEPVGDVLIPYIVLAVSFVFEGTSWLKAVRQLRKESEQKQVGFFRHLIHSPDPTVKTVAFEDTAALIGLVLAAIGVFLDSMTGTGRWDGAASLAIGLLLIAVAYTLGHQSARMLVGQAVGREERVRIREVICESLGIDNVMELLTMRLGPEEVLVAARVDMEDAATGADIERIADEVDHRVREAVPSVRHVFLDPTPPSHDDEKPLG